VSNERGYADPWSVRREPKIMLATSSRMPTVATFGTSERISGTPAA
jgi:hypothetical protein